MATSMIFSMMILGMEAAGAMTVAWWEALKMHLMKVPPCRNGL
jgi:hypothetical protein